MTKLRFHCSKCKATIRVPIQHVGKMVVCPHCKMANRVPSPGRKQHEEVDADDGSLKLPPRTAHARYHDKLEAQTIEAQAQVVQRAERQAQRKSRLIWWLLVIVNALVFAGLIAALAMIWSADGNDPPVPGIDDIEPTKDGRSPLSF